MRVTKRAIEYLKKREIKSVKISLAFTCTISAKIEVFKNKIEGNEIDGIVFAVDEDAEIFLQGLTLDADEGLFFRAEN